MLTLASPRAQSLSLRKNLPSAFPSLSRSSEEDGDGEASLAAAVSAAVDPPFKSAATSERKHDELSSVTDALPLLSKYFHVHRGRRYRVISFRTRPTRASSPDRPSGLMVRSRALNLILPLLARPISVRRSIWHKMAIERISAIIALVFLGIIALARLILICNGTLSACFNSRSDFSPELSPHHNSGEDSTVVVSWPPRRSRCTLLAWHHVSLYVGGKFWQRFQVLWSSPVVRP